MYHQKVKFFICLALFFLFSSILYAQTEETQQTKPKPKPTMTAEDYYILAEDQYTGGFKENAIENYKKALNKNPKHLGSLKRLAEIYNLQGKYSDAVLYIEKALKIKPNYPGLNDTAGVIYRNLGNEEKAKMYFQKACDLGVKASCDDLKTKSFSNQQEQPAQPVQNTQPQSGTVNPYTPGSADYYYKQGKIYQGQGKYTDALNMFLKAISVNPSHAAALEEAGYEYAMAGKPQTGIDYYKKAIQVNPSAANAWDRMGLAYKSMNNIPEAIKAFEQACKLGIQASCTDASQLKGSTGIATTQPVAQPQQTATGLSQAETYYQEGKKLQSAAKYEEALNMFLKAISINPNHYQALTDAGFELAMKGKYNDAISYYSKALQIAPTYSTAWDRMGLAYKSMNNIPEAIKAFEQACKLGIQVSCTDANQLKGSAGTATPQSAAQPAATANNAVPNTSEWYYQEGKKLQSAAKYEEALNMFLKAVELNPKNAAALEEAGFEFAMKGDNKTAISYYNLALKLNPKSGNLWDRLGLAQKAAGNTAEAIKAFDEACKLGIQASCTDAQTLKTGKQTATPTVNTFTPGTADYFYQQGKIYQGQAKYADALDQFLKAVEKDPKHAKALEEAGFEYAMSGNHKKAIEFYVQATKIVPSNGNLWDRLGLAYKASGDLENAKKAFEQACKLGIQVSCTDAQAITPTAIKGQQAAVVKEEPKEKKKVAVLEFLNFAKITTYEAQAITDMVRMAAREVLSRTQFMVMTRESILQLLPPGKNLESCEGECEVETGKNIGADYIVSGEIGRFGRNLQIKMKLFDTKTSDLLGVKIVSAPTIDKLEKPINDEAERLFEKIK